MRLRLSVNIILGLCIWLPAWCLAQSQPTINPNVSNILIIKNHQFIPSQINVTAGQKFVLTVENQDPTVEEFESYDLNREKIVQANGKIKVFLGPLRPGSYKFFGDYHQSTAQGIMIAK